MREAKARGRPYTIVFVGVNGVGHSALCDYPPLARAQVREAKARGRPYTIVFVGVNGVGKSTNLAKVAYWLLQNDVSVRACVGALHFWRCAPARALRSGCCKTMCQCAPVLAVCLSQGFAYRLLQSAGARMS